MWDFYRFRIQIFGAEATVLTMACLVWSFSVGTQLPLSHTLLQPLSLLCLLSSTVSLFLSCFSFSYHLFLFPPNAFPLLFHCFGKAFMFYS